MFDWQTALLLFFIAWYGIATIFTVYIHRVLAHSFFDISPILEHFFVFCLWFVAGVGGRFEWRQYFTTSHLRHHRYSDTEKDPHSPYFFTFKQLCNEQLVLRSHNDPSNPSYIPPAELAKYAYQNKASWIESNVYWKYPRLGQITFWIMCTILAGIPGFVVGAIFYRSNVIITFVGKWAIHKIGSDKENPVTHDRSKNSFLIALVCGFGGEEYHRYHHDDPSKPYFHRHWYQVDLGWVCCRIFMALGLLKLRNPTST